MKKCFVIVLVATCFFISCDKIRFVEEYKGVKFKDKKITMMVGDTVFVEYTYLGSPLPETYHDRMVVWSSSDPWVATVYRGGQIIARKTGNTNIKAYGRGVKGGGDGCLVIVIEKE